ncbi:MAG: hypothetical protein ABI808_05985 [Pseudonocardiales bacterium]
MTGIAINPDTLAQAAQNVDGAAQTLSTQLTALQTTVTTDSPWGSDEQGTIFGSLYGALLGHGLEAMGSHYEKLGGAANGLAGWAQQMADTEQGVTQTVESAGQGIGA